MIYSKVLKYTIIILVNPLITVDQSTDYNEELKIPERTLAMAVAGKMPFPTSTNSIKEAISTTAESRDEAMFLKNDLYII
jgi:hypothetical protein